MRSAARRPGRLRCLPRLGLCALAGLGCAGAGPLLLAPPPVSLRGWQSVDVGGFELVSDADPEALQRLANRLQLIRSLAEQLTSLSSTRPALPARVYVFGSERDWHALLGDASDSLAGLFTYTLGAGYIALGLQDTVGYTHEVLYHEMVHFVLRNGSARNYPAWYDEGLAQLLASISIREGSVTLGSAPPGARTTLEHVEPLPLGTLLTRASALDRNTEDVARFYADAWAFTHYLHAHRAPDGSRRLDQLHGFLDAIDQGEYWRDAVQLAFGVEPDVLESEFQAHRARIASGVDLVVLIRDAELAPQRHWPAQAVRPARAAYRLGELARAIGKPEVARELFEQAVAREPDFAAARAALARVLAEESGWDAAEAELAAALEADSRDYRVLLALGLRHLERAKGPDGERDPGELNAARVAFRESAQRAPQGAIEPHTMLGNSYLEPDPGADPSEGIEALEQAHRVAGWHPKVNLWLGMLYAQAGDRRRAVSHLRVAANWSHGDNEDWWQAVELLDELEQDGL